MRFVVPGHAVEFDIPDEWWEAAGMRGFVPRAEAYEAKDDRCEPSQTVPFSKILPPRRSPETGKFERGRMICVLKGIGAGTPLPPICIHGPVPDSDVPYAVVHGMHRYHAAAAAGFSAIPAVVLPYQAHPERLPEDL
jgi:hypothetical protein